MGDPGTIFFRNRYLLVLAIVLILVAGGSAYVTLPRAEDPVITNRNPLIITAFPGADAARVDALVTEVIERELQEIKEIKDISSTSSTGVSVVSVALLDSITKETNQPVFSEIRDALADASALFPPGAGQPQFDDKRSAVAYTLIVAISDPDNPEGNLPILGRVAEDLADRLRRVPGTELVRLFGEPEEEIRVTLDEEQSVLLGLGPGNVAALLGAADVKNPAGVLRGPERDQLVGLRGEFEALDRIAAVPVRSGTGESTIQLGDIARIERSIRTPPATIAHAGGTRSVLVGARMQEGLRVDQWAENARHAVEEYRAGYGGGLRLEVIFDQSEYTTAKLNELIANLLAGAGVVLLVVFFLMGWRSALIVGSALPLVAALTLFLLGVFGIKLHQMSIFGMIIALGLLIDNAIVAVDEVCQRLGSVSRIEAVRQTMHHLFAPLLASTATTMLAFAPIQLLPGDAGDFVGSIGGSVILALGGSFFVAMTIIVSLAGLFGHPRRAEGRSLLVIAWRNGVTLPWLAQGTWRVLSWLFARPLLAMAVGLLPGVVGFWAATQLGSQFFPPTDRDMFGFRAWMPRGTSIETTAQTAREMEELVRSVEDVEDIHWIAGGYFPAVYYNQVQENDATPNYFQGYIQTSSNEATERLVPQLQRLVNQKIPAAQVVMAEFGQGPPTFADIEYRLYGEDAETLMALGEELRLSMQQHPEVQQTRMGIERGQPKLWIAAREDEARLAGLSLEAIATQLAGRLEGATGGSILEGPEEVPVRVRYADGFRSSADSIAAANLTPDSIGTAEFIPLEAIAELQLRTERSSLARFNGRLVNTISGFTIPGALPIEVTREVLELADAAGFELPSGVELEIGGNAEQEGDAVDNLGRFLPVLVVLIVALIILTFRSIRLALLLGVVAIMSVGLGQLATWMAGLPVGFNTILGTIGLIGVALNDSIVVLAAIRAHPEAAAGHPIAVAHEVMGTMRHVLSTTFTTIGCFLPLLIFVGGDFWPALAVVLAGGVGGATLLAITFIPAGYILLRPRGRGAD